MKLDSLQQLINNISDTMNKHAPEIFAWSSLFLSFGAGIYTHISYENSKEELNKLGPKASTADKVKVVAKEAILPVSTGAAAIVSMHQSGKINAKRYSSLAAAYAISENKFKEYKNQVIETVGEKKEKTIEDEAIKETIRKRSDIIDSHKLSQIGSGNTKFIELGSNQPFLGDWQKVEDIFVELNYRLQSEMFISLNEILDEFGLEHVKWGDNCGWKVDYGPYQPKRVPVDRYGEAWIGVDFDIHDRYTSLY